MLERLSGFRPIAILLPLGFCQLLVGQDATVDPAPVAVETVELAYAPPDGAVYRVTESSGRSVERAEETPVVDMRMRTYDLAVHKTETGFANVATVESQGLTRNGQAVASPVYSSMGGLMLTHELTDDGKLVGISGYDQLPEAMKMKLPAPLAQQMVPLVNYDSLRYEDETGYRETLGSLPATSHELGKGVPGARLQDLPMGGSVPLYSVQVLNRETSEEGDGVLFLVTRYSSDAKALAEAHEGVEEEDLVAAGMGLTATLPEGHAGAAVQGSVQTRIDEAGLLLAHQTYAVEFTLSLGEPSPEPPADTSADSGETGTGGTAEESSEMSAQEPVQVTVIDTRELEVVLVPPAEEPPADPAD